MFKKIIPLFKCRDIKAAVAFYTHVLNFELKYPNEPDYTWGADLVNGDIELQLTILENPTLFGSVVNIWVDDVDSLFANYVSRGLDQSYKTNSPVHLAPTDQTWGTREFYVTDADGNTLRFCQPGVVI
jgi:catechol 2,3-dioxygenase-like lactoylglutathione lyase family enzyme